MTNALVGALATAGAREALRMDLAKERLREAKFIEIRQAQLAQARARLDGYAATDRSNVDDRHRLRAEIQGVQSLTASAKVDTSRRVSEAEQREKFVLQAEVRALRGPRHRLFDTERVEVPAPAPAPVVNKQRQQKLALMKQMLKRQRLRMIIGRGNVAISRANDRLRRAVQKEHFIEASRLQERLGAPPQQQQERGRGAGRAGGAGRLDVRSMGPPLSRGHSRGGHRSASPSCAGALSPAIEIKPAVGASIIIGDLPKAKR